MVITSVVAALVVAAVTFAAALVIAASLVFTSVVLIMMIRKKEESFVPYDWCRLKICFWTLILDPLKCSKMKKILDP